MGAGYKEFQKAGTTGEIVLVRSQESGVGSN